jgi:uncharacterized protein with NAD-binding domain and iron-sulfur cluster
MRDARGCVASFLPSTSLWVGLISQHNHQCCGCFLFAGSYQYMMQGTTSFPNVFMAGDWIVNRHGSWSQVS